jgi:hypothetical protein
LATLAAEHDKRIRASSAMLVARLKKNDEKIITEF